ncbi:MAG: glycosyltransferase family 4 protein [Bacteroidales bacterium]|nr:glycosyltransferase family 4 protein [Bacteroidales bacterium]
MKLLILTQYYPPETGAAQNRLHELAVRLKNLGVDVSVLTAMPNYPKMKIYDGYRRKCRVKEDIDGITVYRSWIYVRNSKSIFQRLLNYFSFVFTSFLAGCFRTGKSDLILCESPPLFLGISAYLLSRIKRAGLVFNVSDLWPESAEKLGLIKSKTLLGASKRLEEFLYKRSTLVTGQTKGIVDNISSRFPKKHVYWLPNGADLSYYDPDITQQSWRKDHGYEDNDFLVFYGGILGHAQGLEVVIKAADRLRNDPGIKFVLMGNGPQEGPLKELSQSLKLKNVQYFNVVSKAEMPAVLAAINVSVIPLKKLDLFKGAIPSKIFESLAMKKPILLGVEGEAKELFIEEGKCGLAFEPENDEDLTEKVVLLRDDPDECEKLGDTARSYVEMKFNRDKIAADFFEVLSEIKP